MESRDFVHACLSGHTDGKWGPEHGDCHCDCVFAYMLIGALHLKLN